MSVCSQKACCLSLYRDFSVSCSEEIAIDRDDPQWYYYFLCGVKGIQVSFVMSSILLNYGIAKNEHYNMY